MEQKELSAFTDQELLAEAKKVKSASIMSALVIGIMAGVVIYSVVMNSIGFLTLIPLYFIYRIVKSPNKARNQELEKLLAERNLK